MEVRKRQTERLRICKEAHEPDAFLVVSDDSEPDAVPVIPTPMAHSYWAHPSHSGTAAAS
jgi:hypothetical protein